MKDYVPSKNNIKLKVLFQKEFSFKTLTEKSWFEAFLRNFMYIVKLSYGIAFSFSKNVLPITKAPLGKIIPPAS